jgi:hypothetical protein
MMKQEFDKLVGMTTAPECYERIEYVYMNSDFFSNKQQIADFYKAHDMAGIERVYKGILAHKEAVEKLEGEVAALKAEIAAIQKPTAPAEMSDEFIADLAAFSKGYVDNIRAALVQNAGNIAKDATLVRLLHEYNTRAQEERAEYEREVKNVVKHGYEFRPSNNCLTHASSYHDVLGDLLKPYWEGRART